jgi:serine/threonine protein kinase
VHIKSDDPLKFFTDLKKLGQGASGTVYSATDTRTGRGVALKVAPISDLVELTNEIAMQAMSVHPNIVSYIETFATSSELCIVMEYVRPSEARERNPDLLPSTLCNLQPSRLPASATGEQRQQRQQRQQ